MISEKFLTKNKTYTNPTKIKPQYIIVHSTGVGYTNKDVLFNGWNNASVKKSVHGMVDDSGSYHTLPLDYLAWHIGKKGNGKAVGFEICEPKNIAYADKAHTKVDTTKYDPKDAKNIADFNKRYANAIELAVHFCRETGLSADKILSHREACAKGIASNHADVEHWFKLFNKDMDDFRADVKKVLSQKPNPQTGGTKPKETPKSNIVAGDIVTINKGAKYGGSARGKIVPTAQLSPKKHTVAKVQTNSGVVEALLQGINSWVAVEYLTTVGVTKGCKVKVKKGARTYEGKSVAGWVYSKEYTVDELKGKRAVLDRKGLCTAFNVDDLIVQ